jgi:hypothetical protein
LVCKGIVLLQAVRKMNAKIYNVALIMTCSVAQKIILKTGILPNNRRKEHQDGKILNRSKRNRRGQSRYFNRRPVANSALLQFSVMPACF